MTTCQGMDEDINSIEQWATIFTQPTVLSKTVAKHWMFHGTAIKADIAKEETDWSAGDWFAAGADTAAALTLAVGPIENANEANINLEAPLLFVGGIMEGLVGDNNLTELSTCFTDADSVVQSVESIVAAVEGSKWIKAGMEAKKLAASFPIALSACENMNEDVTALE